MDNTRKLLKSFLEKCDILVTFCKVNENQTEKYANNIGSLDNISRTVTDQYIPMLILLFDGAPSVPKDTQTPAWSISLMGANPSILIEAAGQCDTLTRYNYLKENKQ